MDKSKVRSLSQALLQPRQAAGSTDFDAPQLKHSCMLHTLKLDGSAITILQRLGLIDKSKVCLPPLSWICPAELHDYRKPPAAKFSWAACHSPCSHTQGCA